MVLIALTLKLLTKVDAMIHNHAKVFDFYLEFNTSSGVGTFMDTMRTKDIRIVSFDIAKSRLKGEGPSATMSIEVQDKTLRKTLSAISSNGRDKICRRIIGSINTMEDHRMNGNRYDVVIIGGGVIGSKHRKSAFEISVPYGPAGKGRGCLLRHFQGEQRDRSCWL